jgi:hypothetical protein
MVVAAFIILIVGSLVALVNGRKARQSKEYEIKFEEYYQNEIKKDNPIHANHYKSQIFKCRNDYYKYNNISGISFSISAMTFLILIVRSCT